MKADHVYKPFLEIQEYYSSIPSPKYRNARIDILKEKFQQLQHLKDDLGQDKAYQNLQAAMQYVLFYDLGVGNDKDKLHKKLNGRTPNQIVSMTQR